ncbi:unnamed protein product [Cuscuta epithymum]|nr:unnamed protein product [Cuscuta epithymum]
MGGQLLCAVARDGNENMFPLAIAYVDSEDKASWTWFLQVLFQDFGRPEETNWVFMSDKQKGLVEAFKAVSLANEHRYCVKHMYENYKKIFRGAEYKKKLWFAASTGSLRSWERQMEGIKKFDEAAYNWIMQYDPSTWSRSHFSIQAQSDALQNNICESFNAYILRARDMPILSMFEWIRRRLMARFHVKYTAMSKYKGNICPNKQDLLEKFKFESRNCFSTPVGDNLFEVDFYDTSHVVNLRDKTCTCRRWDLNGIPCKHGVSAIYANREKLEDYVSVFMLNPPIWQCINT